MNEDLTLTSRRLLLTSNHQSLLEHTCVKCHLALRPLRVNTVTKIMILSTRKVGSKVDKIYEDTYFVNVIIELSFLGIVV